MLIRVVRGNGRESGDMAHAHDKTRLIDAMRGLLDELSAPDLTIARAKLLRLELARLLDAARELPAPAADRAWSTGGGLNGSVTKLALSELLPFPAPLPFRSVG
jgi:hypothetical protein